MWSRRALRRRNATRDSAGPTNSCGEGETDCAQLDEDRAAEIKQVRLRVLNKSELAISWMPAFYYFPCWAAHSDGTVGEVTRVEGTKLYVVFDASKHETPPMTWNTVFIRALWPLPVPGLPPGLQQQIKTHRLQGFIDIKTGEISLEYESSFLTSILGWAVSPPLLVNAVLTSGEVDGDLYHACGEKLRNGHCTLVAVSVVPKGHDDMQNRIMALPTEALSVLRAELDFVTK